MVTSADTNYEDQMTLEPDMSSIVSYASRTDRSEIDGSGSKMKCITMGSGGLKSKHFKTLIMNR